MRKLWLEWNRPKDDGPTSVRLTEGDADGAVVAEGEALLDGTLTGTLEEALPGLDPGLVAHVRGLATGAVPHGAGEIEV